MKTSLFRKYKFLSGRYKGQIFRVYYSDHPKKKYEVNVNGKTILHGAKGYSVAPGKTKGKRYCTRSSGIKGRDDIMSANFWSALNWNCTGRNTSKSNTFQTPLGVVKVL